MTGHYTAPCSIQRRLGVYSGFELTKISLYFWINCHWLNFKKLGSIRNRPMAKKNIKLNFSNSEKMAALL